VIIVDGEGRIVARGGPSGAATITPIRCTTYILEASNDTSTVERDTSCDGVAATHRDHDSVTTSRGQRQAASPVPDEALGRGSVNPHMWPNSARRPSKVLLTPTVISIRGGRAVRQMSIRLVDGPVVAEVTTEWAWVPADDGRPLRLPAALIDLFAASGS